MPTLAQVYEDHAADCTRAAEQTDDPVFREMLLTLALQWRLAAREEAATQSQPKMTDRARWDARELQAQQQHHAAVT